ncbi:transposase [Streptomyces pratensis]|uniref:IS701 family transposase n=1 Tax=Streptomyces pratensis TaxID=1169025 RepID=UPI0030183545
MRAASVAPHPWAEQPVGFSRTDGRSEVVEELCAALFSSLRRKDQRERAKQYVYGLLVTEGRKSMRNIAAALGEPATVQGLHHFIANSTWDWQPVRAALAAHVQAIAPPRAWVVQPMSIPKTGTHSVGVDEIFDPLLGQTFRGQRAFGVWSVSPELAVPVNWRLFLPARRGPDTIEDGDTAVERPRGGEEETLQDCAVAAAFSTPCSGQSRHRPVVLDIPGGATRATMTRFDVASVPVTARTIASCRLMVADRTAPGFGQGPLPAAEILESVRDLGRPVHRPDPGEPRRIRSSLAAAVPVSLPNMAGRGRLLLLGEWRDAKGPPELWLTNMARAPVAGLLELVRLADEVGRETAGAGEEVGLRDFVGRSFRGWHHHVTLASVAHAVTVLNRRAGHPPYAGLRPSS